jgi:hypothetical protein
MTPQPARWQRLFAIAGDSLMGVFVALALWTHLFEGFRIGSGAFAISTRSAERLLVQAALICVIRHLVVRTPSLRQRIVEWIGARPSSLVEVPAREWALSLAAFVPLTLWFLWPQVVTPGGVPDHGDPLFSMWTLSHIADRLAHAPSQFFDGRIFFPEPDTFLWSDLTLLPGLMAAPFIWAGVPVAAAYTTLILLGCLLSCLTMFALVRASTGLVVPALVAGALFGFFPYRFAQYSHLQMQGIFLMPLAVWLLMRTLERPGRDRGLQLGLAVALQLLWSTYCGAYLVVALSIVTVAWWLSGREIVKSHVWAGAVAVGICAVLLAPYLSGYYRARTVVGERPRAEVLHYGADLGDYLSPNGNSRWYGHRAPMHDKSEERHLFPGVGPIALAATGLIAAPTTASVIAAGGLVAAVNGSLGLTTATYSFFFDYVPLLRTFRVPARFGLVVGVFLIWAAGLGVARLWRLSEGRLIIRALVVVACAAAVVEAQPGLQLRATPFTAPEIYGGLPTDRRAVVLELPVPGQGAEAYWVDPSYLYASTFHKHTLINGYSGYYPSWYGNLTWASSALPDDKAWAAILLRQPEFLIVHEEHYGRDRYLEVVADLARRGDVTLLSRAQTTAGEDRLYRVHAAAAPTTPRSTPDAVPPASTPARGPLPLR